MVNPQGKHLSAQLAQHRYRFKLFYQWFLIMIHLFCHSYILSCVYEIICIVLWQIQGMCLNLLPDISCHFPPLSFFYVYRIVVLSLFSMNLLLFTVYM